MEKQCFFLVVYNYDECTVPCKIFLQEKDAIKWGRGRATKISAEDSNYEFVLYKQEITRGGELKRVKTLYPYSQREMEYKGADYDIDRERL